MNATALWKPCFRKGVAVGEPKFKVGDRVKVYGLTRSGRYFEGNVGIVKTLSESGPLLVKFGKAEVYYWVHPKQCRRLVKKKKEETITLKDFGTIDFGPAVVQQQPSCTHVGTERKIVGVLRRMFCLQCGEEI